MKLYASPTSPYARLVRTVVLEKRLSSRVETVWVDPWASSDELLAINPCSRVPALVSDDGSVITESLLIALYIERRFPEPKLVRRESREWGYHKLGLGNGVIDAAVGIVAARKFRDDADSDPVVKRRFQSLERAVPAMAETVATLDGRPDLGDLSLAVALGYLDFRLPGVDWRGQAPALGKWYETVSARPSLEQTRPDAPEAKTA
jgi:glutathione S-transferase